jgi:hypothetical protein
MKPATEISIRLRPPVRLAGTAAITLVAELVPRKGRKG